MHACECECGHHAWDEPVEASPADLANRAIRPLPLRKRQRVDQSGQLPVEVHQGVAALSLSSAALPESGSESDSDDRLARDARAAARAREASALTAGRRAASRSSGSRNEHGEADGREWDDWLAAQHHPLPLDVSRDPERTSGEAPDHSTQTTNSLDPGSTSSDSPPTSPALSGSDSHNLFGDEGQRIAKSLATASSFSPAGLFGGLGLATLHPSLAPPVAERHFDEDEDGDEDSYGVVDRSRPPVEPTFASQASATALGLGESNKKKRKIPGLSIGSAPPRDADTSVEPVQPPAPVAPVTRPEPTPSSEFKSSKGPLAPVNPPTTAEAALAKLRIRPPHVSLCDICFTNRRHRRKRFRASAVKQHPLALPDAPAFVPPAMPREGPAPMAGVKGSKAIKLAMKAAKEREKEKERVRMLFAHVRVPDNLYDPKGKADPPPSVVTRAIKADLDRRKKDGVPMGAEGGDSLLDSATHALDLFTFAERPPPLVEQRWNAVNDQKDRLKAAKERAARAREEEDKRRREKEERERAEAAAAAEAPPPAPATAPAAATAPRAAASAAAPARTSAAPRAATAPATAPAVPAPAAPATPVAVPPAPTPPPAAALPPPPPPPPLPRKGSSKKGRKKRSAHANALNVHHRDNYVPSRLPSHVTPTPGPHDGTPQLTSWPASEEALASAGPYASTCGGGHFCGHDEWLCLFCEYELFYGEESLLYKAIRKRKNVLKVRRKAQARAHKATGAAAGEAAPAAASTSAAVPSPAAPADSGAAVTEGWGTGEGPDVRSGTPEEYSEDGEEDYRPAGGSSPLEEVS
ncbi:uncharacterized protein JCM10292_004540 [Rhodotorula paludigena]|uniref:uncharacterized protein n=1 Tax=Rhodotorula paludigena TaxID=86838 RepID=UPI00317C0447